MKKGVGVIILNDKDEILLLKRGDKDRGEQNVWENAGGESLPNESFEETARREVKEETGCELISLTKLYHDNFGDWEITVFEGKIFGVPTIGDTKQHIEMKWFAKDELKSLPLASYARKDFEKTGWI